MKNDFLPANYELPEKASGYLRFTEGTHKFRILSSPVLGWEFWDKTGDKPKVTRYAYDSAHPSDAKHFWVMVVYNYEMKRVQILSISQSTIQEPIKALAMNEDWGSPLEYDITLVRTGQGMNDTKYSITPSPKKPLSDEVKKAYATTKISLDKFMKGEDPFEVTPEDEKSKIDERFPDNDELDSDDEIDPDKAPF